MLPTRTPFLKALTTRRLLSAMGWRSPSPPALVTLHRPALTAFLPFQRPLLCSRTMCTAAMTTELLSTPGAPPAGAGGKDLCKLRRYQQQALDEVISGWQEGTCRRQMVAMATGAGKTVTFCQLVKMMGRRTLILVNRKELLQQTVRTLHDVGIPAASIGIVHNKRRQYDKHIVVATIQSACQTVLPLLTQENFELLIVDEAHHSTASSYLTVMVHTGFLTALDAENVARANKGLPAFLRLPSPEAGSEIDASPDASGSAALEARICLSKYDELEDGAEGVIIQRTQPETPSQDSGSDGSSSLAASFQQASSSAASDSDGEQEATRQAGGAHSDALDEALAGLIVSESDEGTSDLTGSYVGSGNSIESDSNGQASDGDSVAVVSDAGEAGQAVCGAGISRGEKLVLGVTATPYRNDDRQALAVVYEREAYNVSIADLIQEGHLCQVKAHRILTWTDISNVPVMGKMSASDDDGTADYKAAELSKVVNTESRNTLVVDAYKTHGQGRKAVAFCCDIDHAQALATLFTRHGIRADCITSMSGKDRDRLLEAHKNGDIEVLTNVGILTEGYDDPSISCILMTRPTKSTGLYTQCVGRGLRTAPGKEDCLILDFTDRSHRLDKASDLITCEYLLQNTPGVELVNYKTRPSERVAPEIKNMLRGGAMKLFGDTEFAWTALNNDLWMKLIYKPPSPKYQPQPKRKASQQTSPDAKSEPPRTAWAHLKCDGHTTIRKKDHLLYQLRMAVAKDMPALDSPTWQVLEADDSQEQYRFLAPKHTDDDDDDDDDDVEPLLPTKVTRAVERRLLRALLSEFGPQVTKSMLTLVERKADWHHKGATDNQMRWIQKECQTWGLFESEDDIPNYLSRGQASTLINFGVLYEAYRKANPDEDDESEHDLNLLSLKRTLE